MKISEIYKRFGIPPNLQEHMIRVASIVSLIERHWTGESLDWKVTKSLALVHDLGNVVKMDNKNYPEYLGREQVNITYWNKKQNEIVAKYGEDDNEATRKMLLEIGINQKTADIVFNKRFTNSLHTRDSNNWSLIIMYYGDLRVLPLGVGTLEERLADIRARYLNYATRPDFEDLLKACRDIENMIQENLNVPVSNINNELVNEVIEKNKEVFLSLEI